jgi:hypothetical protein
MNQPREKVCSVCQVKIVASLGGDKVNFSVGPQGSRTVLWQRVCQHVKRPGCINTNPSTDSLLKNDGLKMDSFLKPDSI